MKINNTPEGRVEYIKEMIRIHREKMYNGYPQHRWEIKFLVEHIYENICTRTGWGDLSYFDIADMVDKILEEK